MPIYLTGYIDEHTDSWKQYHDDFLPIGMIVQPKTHREGYLGRAGLYKWVAIDNDDENRSDAHLANRRAADDLCPLASPCQRQVWLCTRVWLLGTPSPSSVWRARLRQGSARSRRPQEAGSPDLLA